MICELAKPEDLQAVYNVVQHTVKTIYPKYYPMEVVDFFCELYKISTDINYDGRKFIPKMNSENGEVDEQTNFTYHQNMQIKTGKCHSVPTVLENGKIELSEGGIQIELEILPRGVPFVTPKYRIYCVSIAIKSKNNSYFTLVP